MRTPTFCAYQRIFAYHPKKESSVADAHWWALSGFLPYLTTCNERFIVHHAKLNGKITGSNEIGKPVVNFWKERN